MADVKISQLPAIVSPAGDDVLPVVDDSAVVTNKITITQLNTFFLDKGTDGIPSGANVTLDFDPNLAPVKTLNLIGGVTFATTNLAAGRSIQVRISAGGADRSLTFPAGWTFLGGPAPTLIPSGKTAILSATAFGAADADVVAGYSFDITETALRGSGAVNQVGVFSDPDSVDGSANLTWDGSLFYAGGRVRVGVDGTEALPALHLGATDDPDTGFWHPAADTLAVSTGGAEAMRISSNGDVGIGVVPTSTFDVHRAAASAYASFRGGGTANAGVVDVRNSTDGNYLISYAFGSTATLNRLGASRAGTTLIEMAPTLAGAGAAIYTFNATPLRFGTSDVERARFTTEGAFWINEIATPATPSSGFGALYFKTDGELYIKNDAGTESQVSNQPGTGDVTKVGTPVNNQLAIWTGDGTVEGDPNLTWDGTNFSANIQGGGSAVFNNSEANANFRVAATSITNAFYVRGSDGYAGFGTNAPSSFVEIFANVNANRALEIENANSGNAADASIIMRADAALVQVGIYSSTHAAGAAGGFSSADAFQITDSGGTPVSRMIFGPNSNTPVHFVQNNIERMTVGTGEVVVNNPENSYNFRVAADGITNALFVNGADGKVGMGASTLFYNLQVEEAQTADGALTIAARNTAADTNFNSFGAATFVAAHAPASGVTNTGKLIGSYSFVATASDTSYSAAAIKGYVVDDNADGVRLGTVGGMLIRTKIAGTTTLENRMLFEADHVSVENVPLRMEEIAAPATPATGYGVVYPKTDGRLYFKNDGGSEYDLTGSGGAGTGDYVPYIQTVAAETATFTAVIGETHVIDTSAGGFTANLPAIASGQGRIAFYFVGVGAALTVDPNAAETIEGKSTIKLYRGHNTIENDGTEWKLVQRSGKPNSRLDPAQITANQDGYNPTDWGADVSHLYIDSDAERTISGFEENGFVEMDQVVVFNDGSNNIIIAHDAATTVANRVLVDGGSDIVLGPDQGGVLVRDGTVNKWRFFAFSDTREYTAHKTADQNVASSTALVTDTHLTVGVRASTTYRVKGRIFVTMGAGGIQLGLGGTATITSMKGQVKIWDDATLAAAGRVTALDGTIGDNTATGDHFVEIDAVVQVNAAGTLALRWAQNVSDAANTTVQTDSGLEILEL